MITLKRLPASAPLPPGTIRLYKSTEPFDPPPLEWAIHDEQGEVRGAFYADLVRYFGGRKEDVELTDSQVQSILMLAENFPGVQVRKSREPGKPAEVFTFVYSDEENLPAYTMETHI